MVATPTVAAAEARAVDWAAVLKDSALAALVAFALFATMVGLRLTESSAGLVLETRFTALAVAVALVFLGRLALGLIREGLALPVLIVSAVAIVYGLAGLAPEDGAFGWLGHAGAALPLLPSSFLHVAVALGGLVLAFRAAWSLWQGRGSAPAGRRERSMDRLGARAQRGMPYLVLAAIVFAVALPFIPWAGFGRTYPDRSMIDLATTVLIYVMLAWGLNIIVGLAGLLDLGYVAFYAVGAYSYALLGSTFGWSFWVCLPLAGVLAASAGLVLGFPVLRLRGDYFAIVTLGFGEIIRVILLNWVDVTNGPNGISNIPDPSFFGLAQFTRNPGPDETAFHDLFGLSYNAVHRIVFLYYLILALALVVNLFTLRIRRLPIGRAWEALREDDVACQSLGINRRNVKLAAFMISAMFGGFAGSFFATRQGFISPESFSFTESAVILAIVVLGGMGSQVGIVLAAVLLIGLPELFRDLAEYRMLAFGAALVLIMIWRPRGLLSHREPTVLLLGRRRRRALQEAAGGAAA